MTTVKPGARRRQTVNIQNAYTVEPHEVERFDAHTAARVGGSSTGEGACDASIRVTMVPIGSVRSSPFQPVGRPPLPAIEAVRSAIAATGSAAALLEEEMAFALSIAPEYQRDVVLLTELAADITRHGIQQALEVRQVEGLLEVLSGHRRLIAARLAGLTEVPVVDRGTIDDDVAWLAVVRGNGGRQDFVDWQKAQLAHTRQQQRAARGDPCAGREIATDLGWRHRMTAYLLKIAQAWPVELVSALGHGDEARGHAILGALSFSQLRVLSEIEMPSERVDRAWGMLQGPVPRRTDESSNTSNGAGLPAPTVRYVPLKSGFRLETRHAIEEMSEADAHELLGRIEHLRIRLSARLQLLVGR